MDWLVHLSPMEKAVYANASGLGFLILREMVRTLFSGARARRKEEAKRREADEEFRKEVREKFETLTKDVHVMGTTLQVVKGRVDVMGEVLFRAPRGESPSF